MTSNFCKTSWHPYGHTPEEVPDCQLCHESKIPKKLEFRPHLTTGVIARDRDMEMLVLWLNELRDYLQAKEEASKGEGKRVVMCNECMPPKPMNDHKYLKGVIIHERTDCPPDTLYMVNENLFDKPTPPQQEECKVCEGTGDMGGDNCKACLGTGLPYLRNPNPQLKEESPKEDELPDEVSARSEWEGFNDTSGILYRYFGEKRRPANIQDLQEVFVSKEKIKRLTDKICVRYEILLERATACNEVNPTEHNVTLREVPGWIEETKEQITSLGLGD